MRMSTLHAAIAAGVLAASMGFTVTAANTPVTAQSPKTAVDNEYKAAISKAKADRKSAYAECDKLAVDARVPCRKNASSAYKKAEAEAKATHQKALADLKNAKA